LCPFCFPLCDLLTVAPDIWRTEAPSGNDEEEVKDWDDVEVDCGENRRKSKDK